MAPRQPDRVVDPVGQRVRVRYAKRHRMRFASHRDYQRALERAIRRAGIPVAFSAGFSPHPRISYAGAAPTGMASEAEYLEIALAAALDPGLLRRRLDACLPDGLDVLEVVQAGPGSLVERLEASDWRVDLAGVDPTEAARAVVVFLAADEVLVSRLTKNGTRTVDARRPVILLGVDDTPDGVGPTDDSSSPACAILRLVVRHTIPAVRPDDVLSGLRRAADLDLPVPATVTRMAQGPLDPDGRRVLDPFTPDRDLSPAADGRWTAGCEQSRDVVGGDAGRT